jgi:hypothetical protein
MHQVQAELQRFKRDTAYYEAHYAELLARYPEQWVAIYNQQVVGVAPDYEQLLDELQAKGFAVGQVLVEHLTHHDELLILVV